MNWYPIKLTYEVRKYAFGERLIPETLSKTGLPAGSVAETWEVSDYRDARATIRNGDLEGSSFHDVVMEHPAEMVGDGWSGPHFPLLAKFLDASHALPVHLHADDEAAARIYGEPNGKTESWHILWAEPDATVLAGIKSGTTEDEMRDAFIRQDYDAVMPRYPINAGDTVYVPGGILHSFGPGTLIFEIQQTSDLAQTVMPEDLYGIRFSPEQWQSNIDQTLAELRTDYLPAPNSGLEITKGRNSYRVGSTGPYFALERWNLTEAHTEAEHRDRCFTMSNVGDPVQINYGGGIEELAPGESCVIPAALDGFTIEPESVADLVVCYVPNLERHVILPLENAGHSRDVISKLGQLDI